MIEECQKVKIESSTLIPTVHSTTKVRKLILFWQEKLRNLVLISTSYSRLTTKLQKYTMFKTKFYFFNILWFTNTVEPRITGLRITGQTRITGQNPGADTLH